MRMTGNNSSPTFMPKSWLLMILVISVGFASCSRRNLPTASPVVTDSRMKAFIDSGTGKKLDTGRTKPEHVIKSAHRFLGTPHCMGGITERCMDCSGLTYASFAEHKIELPRRSQDQARYGRIITDRSALRRGDLVFFTLSYNTADYITHVGIFLGNNRFIHASTSSGVIITPLDNPWWNQRFVFGTRIFQ